MICSVRWNEIIDLWWPWRVTTNQYRRLSWRQLGFLSWLCIYI